MLVGWWGGEGCSSSDCYSCGKEHNQVQGSVSIELFGQKLQYVYTMESLLFTTSLIEEIVQPEVTQQHHGEFVVIACPSFAPAVWTWDHHRIAILACHPHRRVLNIGEWSSINSDAKATYQAWNQMVFQQFVVAGNLGAELLESLA